jgi:hypothetical protein
LIRVKRHRVSIPARNPRQIMYLSLPAEDFRELSPPVPRSCPVWAQEGEQTGSEIEMLQFTPISADTIIVAMIVTIALREAMLAFLPASVVGPNGWLLRTDPED